MSCQNFCVQKKLPIFVGLRMILNLGAFWKMFETLPSQQCIATEMLNGQLIIYKFFKKLFGLRIIFVFSGQLLMVHFIHLKPVRSWNPRITLPENVSHSDVSSPSLGPPTRLKAILLGPRPSEAWRPEAWRSHITNKRSPKSHIR